jgi:hypothetical protein
MATPRNKHHFAIFLGKLDRESDLFPGRRFHYFIFLEGQIAPDGFTSTIWFFLSKDIWQIMVGKRQKSPDSSKLFVIIFEN